MVEAVAKDGEMSVHVRRGAGKSYSDEGSLLPGGGGGGTLGLLFSLCPKSSRDSWGKGGVFMASSLHSWAGRGHSHPEKTF